MRVEHIGDCTLYLADCADVLPTLSGIDAVVTDPPYGLSFMGKKWDYQVPGVAIWELCLAAMKPGAHLLSFAGTRTQHRMAVNIEDAGFEIRDMIAWVYGSGFPKSHNLKGEWAGWGTALKPALEPITVARKPLNGTVAANVLEHGTGGINVDGCRVATNGESLRGGASDGSSANKCHEGWDRPWKNDPKATRWWGCWMTQPAFSIAPKLASGIGRMDLMVFHFLTHRMMTMRSPPTLGAREHRRQLLVGREKE
jgi:hypothetical protein